MPAAAPAFRAGVTALVRSVARPALLVPPVPDLDDQSTESHARRLAWLRAVRADTQVSEALRHASPVLASEVQVLCGAAEPSPRDVKRAASSTARYLLRAQHRPTPFGLFAGVTTAQLDGTSARAAWGPAHTVTARPAAAWLDEVIRSLENCAELVFRLHVTMNNTVSTRGSRLVVPYRADLQDTAPRAVEASIALTEPVKAVLAASNSPVPVGELADHLSEAFPAAAPAEVQGLLHELIRHGVLFSSLHAPSTETDPLRHVLDELAAVGAERVAPVTETVHGLRDVYTALGGCGTEAARHRVAQTMQALAPAFRGHPLALDLSLDADLVLPAAVAREIERAASVLTRVCLGPYGTPSWGAFHQRFYERYGIGTLVPLPEAVADSGVGYPDGYPGFPAGPRRPRLTGRDDALIRIAQVAALDGQEELVLTDDLIAELDVGPDEPRFPPHLELGVRVYADSVQELQRGQFRLEVVSVSRGAGVSTGRFLSVLPPAGREGLAAELAALPAADAGTVPVQLSFPPLMPASAHVTRTPQVLETVLSIQEHRTPTDSVLSPGDIAVGCDGRRLYLAVPERGHRIEPVGMHALNLRTHTPPLVRFLTELPRSQCAQVTTFDWGAASAMPYVPRLRYGRTVLAPARWRLEATDLVSSSDWSAGLAEWLTRRRVPQRVFLVEDDKRLFLDLGEPGHRGLLRQHLDRIGSAALIEAPAPDAYGWCEGRAHEVVVPLKAVRPASWPPVPAPTVARLLAPEQTQPPATSSVLLASLYGDLGRQDTVLSDCLPDLLDRLGGPPWWFIRFRDPDQHLRLRIALPGPDRFGETARIVAAWATELRALGLLSELRLPTSYLEMGRWGSAAAWDAAEEVFRADSRAVLAQLRTPSRPDQRALVAAHTVAIVSAFLGSTEAGMRWLIEHVPRAAPSPMPRSQFSTAVRLADPSHDWAALRSERGGRAVVAGWADRDAALVAYRAHLPGKDTEGISSDDVLTSLLHTHFVRHVAVNFPEEEICLYLARAAALAWTARTRGAA